MADRTVKVSLLLNATGYMQGVEKAAVKTRELGSETEKLAAKREAFNVLGVAALGFGTAVGAGVALAVSKFAEFDQAMSAVQAATHETSENMDLLRDAAIEAGARTVYSATEAAAAVEELSKAGISTADVLGGALDGALDLAAAGNIQVADAAEIAASAMTQFGLKGTDVSRIADLLAAGAGKAQGGVSELSEALNQSGLVAAQMGLSLDDTVGTLSLFAKSGLLGSDAGTSFRNMLLRLANPTKAAAKEMEALGLDFYDAQGQFIGMENVAGQLQTRLQGLTQEQRNAALASIFGQDAIRAAAILYDGGAKAVAGMTKEVQDWGYAQDTASRRLDNLKGDWEGFTGALDSALITMGEGANGPLRELVQRLTDMVNGFNNLPDWAQQTTLGVGAVTSAVALSAGAFMTAVPKIAEYNKAIATMGPGAQRASRLIGALGRTGGVVAGFVALAYVANSLDKALGRLGDGAKTANETMEYLLEADFDGMFQGLTKGANGVNDLDSALDQLLSNDWETTLDRWGSDLFAFTGLSSSTGQAREQVSLLGEQLATLVNNGDAALAKKLFTELAQDAAKQGYSVEELNGLMPEYQDALTGVKNESKLAGDAIDGASGDIDLMAGAADVAERELDTLKDALYDVGGAARDLGSAQDAAQSAINRMVQAAKEEGVTLFGTNDASISLRDSLREVEERHIAVAEQMIENGKSADEASEAYLRGRDALVDQVKGYFESREAAEQWADTTMGNSQEVVGALRDAEVGADNVSAAVSGIPDRHIKVTLTADAALQKIREVNSALAGMSEYKGITIGVGGGVSGLASRPSVDKPRKALGGPIYGHGPKGVDSVDILAAPGEHVLTAREVDAAGGHGAVEAWRASLLNGGHWQQGSDFGATAALAAEVKSLRTAVASLGSRPTVNSLTLQSTGDIRSDLEETVFQLRSLDRGGRHGW